MAERQQALARELLKDKDVQSLSSFIGVDGTNNTLNSGRFLINLKCRRTSVASISAFIRRSDAPRTAYRASRSICSRCRT